MRTAEEIILEIKELPPEEIQKIEDYLLQDRDECELSPEELAEVNQREADAGRGENLSPEFNSIREMKEYLLKNIENDYKIS